jgi:hypothetical protein
MTDEEISLFLAPNNRWLIRWGPNYAVFFYYSFLIIIPKVIFFLIERGDPLLPIFPNCDPPADPYFRVINTLTRFYSIAHYAVINLSVVIVGIVYVPRIQEGLGIKQELCYALVVFIVVFGTFILTLASRPLFLHQQFEFPSVHIIYNVCHFFFIFGLEVMPVIRSFRVGRGSNSDSASIASGSTSENPDTGSIEFKERRDSAVKSSPEDDTASSLPKNQNRRHSLRLKDVLADPQGVSAFREFLTKEFALENLIFYLEVQELYRRIAALKIDNPSKVPVDVQLKKLAKRIAMRFLVANAEMEINVPAVLKGRFLALVESKSQGATEDTVQASETTDSKEKSDTTTDLCNALDKIVTHVLNLMSMDSFARFKDSVEMKNWRAGRGEA